MGWFEGFDADGPFAGVELFGAADVAAGVYRALGAIDVIFDGGTFSIDSSECAHRAEAGYSSCRIRAAGVPLPPGAFVGIAAPGTEAPPRSIVGAGTSAATPAAERAALVALYNATKGANWRRNTNWNTTAPVSDWYGVTTNAAGSVTHVYLWENRLSGTIPAVLGDLTNLRELNLGTNYGLSYSNALSGSIPATLGTLISLQTLNLGNNSLSGTIPTQLGNLGALERLQLYGNVLSGAIPAALGELTNLRDLSLSHNSLSGSIPIELGSLINLSHLGLSHNSLSGSIPAALGSLTNLQRLYLGASGGDIIDDNDLSGSIPIELGSLINLSHLGLSGNSLSGSIPTVLGSLTKLWSLDLSDNDLSGSIPIELGSLARLRRLYLSDNQLSGNIPAALGSLINLWNLGLSGNRLSGSIPAVLGSLTNLYSLDLSGNSLSGCVPAALAAVREISFDPELSYCRGPELLVAVLFDASTVELIFGSALDKAAVPAAGAFAVSVGGARRDVTNVSVRGRKVTLALRSTVESTQTVTVSYTVPATGTKIQSPDGQAADGFSDRAVVFPPDAPTLTGVESTTGGLTVSWGPVTGVSGYEVAWRPDGETAWQSTRTGIRQRYTIGGLDDGVLYWVRVRAVKTVAGSGGRTFSVTSDWSMPAPQIVGDWAPQDLEVTPGDRMLTLAWDDVPVASGYEVEYWPSATPTERGTAEAVPGEDGWSAYVTGLENGVDHDVRVRAVRHLNPDAVLPPSYDRELVSAWANAEGRPGVLFRVADEDSPLFVRGGAVVERKVRLVYVDGDDADSGSDADLSDRPFASRSLGAWILTGPSKGQRVQCRVGAAPEQAIEFVEATGDAPRGQCETDDEGRLTLVYTAGAAVSDSVGNTDHVRLYADPNENQQRDPGESEVDLDPAVAIVRPINYGALGDSYSAGENGVPNDQRPDPFEGRYLDKECRRWTMSYPFLIAGSPIYSSFGFYACTGAVTSDIYIPAGTGVFNGQSSSLHTLNSGLRLGSQQNVDMVTITIGGNDLGFSDVLIDCFRSTCDADSLKLSIDHFKIELGKVLSGMKAAVPHATVFVFGYPQLVPIPSHGFCRDLTLQSAVTAIGGGYPRKSGISLRRGFLKLFGPEYSISANERAFLRNTAVDLNEAISDIAAEKGVHFVAVADEFEGHEPCGDKDAWLNGVVGERVDANVVDSPNTFPLSDRSFHPNAAGHREYARILREYIGGVLGRSERVNRAGLPQNPPATAARRDAAGSSSGGVAGQSSGEGSGSAASLDASAPPSSGTGLLWARRVVPAASACAVTLAPGDRVELFAAGFVPDSAVSFSVRGASVPAAGATSVVELSPAPRIPVATADALGRLEVTWTIPDAPAAEVDAAPRAYVVEASGTDGSGGVFAARSVLPLVAYPGTAPCASDDAARTSLGRPVRVAVLANDFAPAGGVLDAASVTVEAVNGGNFSVNTADGSLTFTPDAGFAGTVTTRYWVYDRWDIGVSATVTVAVEAGCTITGTPGVTVIEGTDGDDVICVPDPDDWDAYHVIDAGAGDDVILGGDGVDWIYGGAGADVVYGRDGRDVIHGGAEVDTIHGGRDFDTIRSDDLADRIVDDVDGYELLLTPPTPLAHVAPVVADDAAHVAVGETLDIAVLANDHDPNGNLVAASLELTRASTLGSARVVALSASEVLVRYAAGATHGVDMFTYEVCDTLNACATAQVTVTVGTSHCTIVGTDGDDILRGTPGDDVICGLGGHDVISGLGGNDILIGGPGNDALYGGHPIPVGAGDGVNVLFGGPGHDTLVGGGGNDVLWGGPGDDTMWGNGGMDTLLGGLGDDRLTGGDGDDTIWGGPGDDTAWGHAGADILHGGPGDDTLTGSGGDDTIWGGPGVDRLSGHGGDDLLWGGLGADLLWGNLGDDILWGGPGSDTLTGGDGDDVLVGGAGDDTLTGDGPESLLGGVDRLWGGSGDDSLDGGAKSDYLDGGPDADACRRGETTARCES